MKKILLLCVISLMISLCGCCIHKWQDANCTEPRKCLSCEETEGEALGHIWVAATCTENETWPRCGETQGEALGHKFRKATCTTPKICIVCNGEEGSPLGHSFAEATCKKPKECTRCGITEGNVGEHDFVDYICRYCQLEDVEGTKKDPRFSFVVRTYDTSYVEGDNYYYVSIMFGSTMGSGSASYSANPAYSWGGDPEYYNGKAYYYTGGSAGYQHSWSYELTETEIIIYSNGNVIGRFVMNLDGSIYCTYGNHYAIREGCVYY